MNSVAPAPDSSHSRCLLVAALAILALAAHSATAAEWRLVGTDADDNRYSVDVAGSSRQGEVVRAQVRTEYATPRNDAASGKSIFVALDTMAVDCATASFAIEYREYVAADGSRIPVVATSRDNLSFKPAAAGSMSEALVRFVCRSATVKR